MFLKTPTEEIVQFEIMKIEVQIRLHGVKQICLFSTSFDDDNGLRSKFIHKYISRSVFMAPTTPGEIRQIILSLRNGKAPEFDNVVPYIILDLTHLVKLGQSGVPDCLKRYVLIPLFKKGDKNSLPNCRPILLILIYWI